MKPLFISVIIRDFSGAKTRTHPERSHLENENSSLCPLSGAFYSQWHDKKKLFFHVKGFVYL